MKKCLYITVGILILHNISLCQQVFEIYRNDSLQMYFDESGKNRFYYYFDNLKDSLPDGTYYFYNLTRKDSLSKYKYVEIQGQYKNYIKNGKFVYSYYLYDKKDKINKLRTQHTCYYKNGKKNGIEEAYNICPSDLFPPKIMQFYGEYVEGRKHGLFMEYEKGYPVSVIVYENDSVKQVLLGSPPDTTNVKIKYDRDDIYDSIKDK